MTRGNPKIQFRLSSSLYEQLERCAQANDLTVHAWSRDAVIAALEGAGGITPRTAVNGVGNPSEREATGWDDPNSDPVADIRQVLHANFRANSRAVPVPIKVLPNARPSQLELEAAELERRQRPNPFMKEKG